MNIAYLSNGIGNQLKFNYIFRIFCTFYFYYQYDLIVDDNINLGCVNLSVCVRVCVCLWYIFVYDNCNV